MFSASLVRPAIVSACLLSVSACVCWVQGWGWCTAEHLGVVLSAQEIYRPNIVKGEVGLAPYDDNGFRTEPFLQEWMLGNLPGALQAANPTDQTE
jgi:hypothetical protein